MRDNAMRHVHLPSGFGVEVRMCDSPKRGPRVAREADAKRTANSPRSPGTAQCCQLLLIHSFKLTPSNPVDPPPEVALFNSRASHPCSVDRKVHRSLCVSLPPPQLSIWDVPTAPASGKQVDARGLVDKCVGADSNSCKIIPGHHSYNGSAT
eukprot:5544888-Prymnesium_polylepis.1